MSERHNHKEQTKRLASIFINRLRDEVEAERGDLEGLPGWVHGAAVVVGRLPGGTIIYFAPSDGGDRLVEYREVEIDSEFFFPGEQTEHRNHMANMVPVDDPEGATMIDHSELIINPTCTITNIGEQPDQNVLQLLNVQLYYEIQPGQPTSRQHVPFALFIPDDRFGVDHVWDLCGEQLVDVVSQME